MLADFLVFVRAVQKTMNSSRLDEKIISKLFTAIDFNNLGEVKLLLPFVPIDVKWYGGDTPLIRAVFKENKLIAEYLLQNGANQDETDGQGQTALFYAYNNNDILKLLLSVNADVNHRDEYGNSPLHHFIDNFDSENILLLLNSGADVCTANNEGLTPLELLLVAKQPIMIKDIVNFNGDDYFARGIIFQLALSTIAAQLIEKGAVIDRTDNCPPLIRAAALGLTKIVELFLKKGANPNISTHRGTTALFQANISEAQAVRTKKRLEIKLGRSLCSNPSQVNYRYKKICRQIENLKEIKKLLIQYGACEIKGNQKSISHIQKTERRYEFLSAVVERDFVKLRELAKTGLNVDMRFLKFKHVYGGNFLPKNVFLYPKDTPLSYAVACKDTELAEVLIDVGADVKQPIRHMWKGYTLLMDAANRAHPPTIRLLIQHGLNPYDKDTRGQSAFDYVSGSLHVGNRAKETLLTKPGLPRVSEQQFKILFSLWKTKERNEAINNDLIAPSPMRGKYTRS